MSEADFTWEVEHCALLREFACPPSELTKKLRLKPVKVFIVGDPIPPGNTRKARISYWERRAKWTGNTEGVNAARHLRGLSRLVEEMHTRRKIIAKLLSPGYLCFKTVVFTNSPNVSITLPLRLTRKMVELDAEWTCSVWSPRRLADTLNRDRE